MEYIENSVCLQMIALNENSKFRSIKEIAEKSESRICGIILYTEKDPLVIKVLNDDDLWNSLDEISGKRWPIFSIRPFKKGSYKKKWFWEKEKKWVEPKENLKYLEKLGIDDSEIIKFIQCPITGKNKYETYDSIKGIVETISKAEKNILPENRKSEAVFREVKGSLEHMLFHKKFGKLYKPVKGFVDYVSYLYELIL